MNKPEIKKSTNNLKCEKFHDIFLEHLFLLGNQRQMGFDGRSIEVPRVNSWYFSQEIQCYCFFRVYGKFKSSNSTTIFVGIPDRYYRSSNASIHKLTSGGNWLQSTPQVHCLKHFYLNRKKKRKKNKMRGHKSTIFTSTYEEQIYFDRAF